jgi:uncharacterized repeat protein (TIGR03803 family)
MNSDAAQALGRARRNRKESRMISLKSVGQMSRRGGLVFMLLSALAGSAAASAQTLETLVSFSGPGIAEPEGSLIADANGNLFGTTAEGGTSNYGSVFEIAKDSTTSSGYASTPTTLVSFDDSDGPFPAADLIADATGNLFGTTLYGGGYGSVFEIAKDSTTSTGYASTPKTLVSFDDSDGAFPFAGLIADANGNLFGTTAEGGTSNYGTVFEIAKTSTGYASTPTTLVSFDGNDGASPFAGLIADASGNLYGTTVNGGASEVGTVFEIARDSTTSTGYASTPKTLVSFDVSDGSVPAAGLIADANGNLYGTTINGGASGVGTVFEIARGLDHLDRLCKYTKDPGQLRR